MRVPTRGVRVQFGDDLTGREVPLGNSQTFRPLDENRTKTPESKSQAALRALLAWRLRPHQRARIGQCRTVRTAPTVQLVGRNSFDGSKRLILKGLATCGSVHSCPQCAAPILRTRAHELTEALENWGRERVAICTFTLRHHHGIPLVVLRTLLSRAFGEIFAGKAGQKLRAELGVAGHVRSAEQTYGDNGWHPHLHVLLFFDAPLADDTRLSEQLFARWTTVVTNVFDRLVSAAKAGIKLATETDPEAAAEALSKVSRLLGSRFSRPTGGRLAAVAGSVPDACRFFLRGLSCGLTALLPQEGPGVHAEVVRDDAKAAQYLAKMGLELNGILSKDGKPGHYTPWQLANLAANGEQWAQALWREHSAAMMGANQLTWSPGFRARAGLEPERPDCDVADDTQQPGDVDVVLADIDGERWDVAARRWRQRLSARLYQQFDAGRMRETERSYQLDPYEHKQRAKSAGSRAWLDECDDLRVSPSNHGTRYGSKPDDVSTQMQRAFRTERRRKLWSAASREIDRREKGDDRRAHLTKAERLAGYEELRHHLLFEQGFDWLK